MQGLTPHEQALRDADGGHRAAVIRGLQDLAAFLAAHPRIPVPLGITAQYTVLNGEHSEVDRIAGEAHAEVHSHGGHYETQRDFGPVSYMAIATSDDATIAWDKAMQVFVFETETAAA